LTLNYDDSLFYNCYKFNGFYQCEKYKGSKSLIRKLFSNLQKNCLIVTKKEPLCCNNCGTQIGWFFNNFGNDEKSVCACGSINQDQKWMYDNCEILQCDECGKYYCYDCGETREFDLGFICDNCKEIEFKKFRENKCDGNCQECEYDWKCNYVENMIDRWGTCQYSESDKRFGECGKCELKEECLSEAEDACDGMTMFHNMFDNDPNSNNTEEDFWNSID
jgi:hypothetical protein